MVRYSIRPKTSITFDVHEHRVSFLDAKQRDGPPCLPQMKARTRFARTMSPYKSFYNRLSLFIFLTNNIAH